jgi:hypothetical protein
VSTAEQYLSADVFGFIVAMAQGRWRERGSVAAATSDDGGAASGISLRAPHC